MEKKTLASNSLDWEKWAVSREWKEKGAEDVIMETKVYNQRKSGCSQITKRTCTALPEDRVVRRARSLAAPDQSLEAQRKGWEAAPGEPTVCT